jgi:hypothetical protein
LYKLKSGGVQVNVPPVAAPRAGRATTSQHRDLHRLCEGVGAKLGIVTGDPHTFTVVLELAEEGRFIVGVPALPELGTQGDIYDEAGLKLIMGTPPPS